MSEHTARDKFETFIQMNPNTARYTDKKWDEFDNLLDEIQQEAYNKGHDAAEYNDNGRGDGDYGINW